MPLPPHGALRRALCACACVLALLLCLPRPTLAAQPTAATLAASVVADARALIGSPYAYIGDDPSTGFSCIGFVHYLYAQVGVQLPYDLNAAYAAGPRVSATNLQPGDLVFFAGTVWSGLSHVAIYTGDDGIIGADNYATGVELTRLSEPYWQQHLVGATRPLDALGPPQPSLPQPPSTPAPPPPQVPAPTTTPTPAVHSGETLVATTAGAVYTGPGYGYPAIDRLAPRVTVRVVRLQGGWANVAYRGPGSDDYGWIDRRYVGSCRVVMPPTHKAGWPTARPRTAVVTAALLFLRRGPGLHQAVLARLHAGQRVTLLDTRGAWDHVHAGSTTGWAFGRWLSPKKA